jgi:anti-anti-sigma regulatory factor
MSGAIDKPDFEVIEQIAGAVIIIEGELTEANAEEFERRMNEIVQKPQREITLDLYGLDLDDGIALATFINWLRARVARITLKGAPQMLGHNLYRVGLLDNDSIVLIDMRLDEPSGI